MKQRQVKPSPKILKKVKALKRPTPLVKIQKKVQESDEEDEVIEEKVKPRKPAVKKTSKVPKFVVEEPSDDGEEEEEGDDIDEDAEEQEIDDIEEDAEEQEEDEGVSDADGTEEDKENENDEGEEAENGDRAGESEEDNADGDGADDDDDEAPEEEATGREEPTLPSKVKNGPIPMTVPPGRVIFIKNLPKKCKQVDIVEIFAKYGAIDQINMNPNPNSTSAHVAYKTEKAANAALAANGKLKLNDSVLNISLRREKKDTEGENRSIFVKFMRKGTSEEEISEHFKSCGEVESVNLIKKLNQRFALIKFKEQSSIPAALKLNNSILNGLNIQVSETMKKNEHIYDERLTIMLKNKQNLGSLDATKLEAIFSKCGEIYHLDVLCSKNVIAFITFKTEEAAQKALELNGKILQGVDLEIEAYSPLKKWTTIHVSNLSRDCTYEDLTNCFSKAGKIDSIMFKGGGSFATIRFADSDGYCKSFLYNEIVIKGKNIFIMPYSHRKVTMLNKQKNTGFKRHAQNGHSAFKPKRGKFY